MDFHRTDGSGICAQRDAHLIQNLCCNGSGCHAADRFTAGGAAASPVIPKAIFLVKTKIGMPGTVCICDIPVVTGTLVFVIYDHGNGSTSGLSLKDTGEDFHLISFFAGCGIAALPGFPAVQINLNLFFCQGKSCGTAVHNNAQSLSVRFSPGCDNKFFSKR